MTDTPVPEWLTPGAPVAVISGRENNVSDGLTVARILKRDVVLSDGTRFNKTRATPSTTSLYRSGGDSWSVGSTLYPDGSPEVVRARERQAVRRRQSNARILLDRIGRAVQDTPDWTEALALHARLGEVLSASSRSSSSEGEHP